MTDPKALITFTELDGRLVEAAKGIKVLSHLAWPDQAAAQFLDSYNRGSPEVPDIASKSLDFAAEVEELRHILAACDRTHPVGSYIYQTTQSYITAALMLENMGTPAFTELSSELYGTPSDRIGRTGVTNLVAAEHFVSATDDFMSALRLEHAIPSIPPEEAAMQLEAAFRPFFVNHPIEIVVDPSLTSKAAAGARRVRLRGGTKFTALDIGQLAQHEGFVHAATMLNGREQPHLKSMGLGAPRTTGIQEGLATFAEMITNTMDILRLRRIALRIKGMHAAIEGADFVEVFRIFLEAGQDDLESFQSTARIFRGGNPAGGVVFTKDVVYLQGLMFLHTFLRKAIQQNKYMFANHLFIGRVTLGDVVALEPFIESGYIVPPMYEPEWVKNRECLAAYLCYSGFAGRISLSSVRLDDFSDHDLVGAGSWGGQS